jgi:hypothetical protein
MDDEVVATAAAAAEKGRARVARLSRRRFLMGAAGLAALAAAGCGGGGDSGGGSYNGTYRQLRFFGENDSVAASVSVDRDGRLTYWTLRNDRGDTFADFGQTRLDDERFDVTEQGIRTAASVRFDDIEGYTEEDRVNGYRFDWRAARVGSAPELPPRAVVGTFAGDGFVNGLNMTVLLTVSPDGNATFLGYFEDPNVADDDFYAFESLSIDRDGDGYDYFLDLFGDRISLRDDQDDDIRLSYRFANDPDLGDLSGRTFSLRLRPTRSARQLPKRATRGRSGRGGARSLDRVFEALKKRAAGGGASAAAAKP